MIERYHFHPLVALWLKKQNYSYQHEVKMPERDKADFVAQHPDGHTLVVECKVGAATHSEKSLTQLLNYQRQIPGSVSGYAIPADLISEALVSMCKARGIWLIPIEIPEALKLEIQKDELLRAKTPKDTSIPGKHLPKIEKSDLFPDRVVLLLYRDFIRRFQKKMEILGYKKASEAHFHALIQIDSGGTRLVTLAERAQMTKQSMGDLIHDLEAQGYVEREKDSTNKRASIIRFTERGQQFLADAYEVKLEVEAEYRAILGDSAVEQFFDLAGKILEHAADEPIT